MRRIIVASAAFALLPATAYAQAAAAPAAAPIPYGDWIGQVLVWGRDFGVLLLIWLVKTYAPPAIQQFLTDRVLANGLDYAIAAVDGAVKGKVLDLPQLDPVLATAEAYVIRNAPVLAAQIQATLRAKLLARLLAAGMVPPVASSAVAKAAPLSPASPAA